MERFPLLSEVLTYPNPLLRQVSKAVDTFDTDILRGIEHMMKIMDREDGCGLAAPQIGVFLRVIVIDTVSHGGRRMGLINPEIIEKSVEQTVCNEGCLSVTDLYADVSRSTSIKLRYINECFDQVEEEWTGFPAINLQHEIDHLNGVLFIDHLPRIQRERVKEKLRRQAAIVTD